MENLNLNFLLWWTNWSNIVKIYYMSKYGYRWTHECDVKYFVIGPAYEQWAIIGIASWVKHKTQTGSLSVMMFLIAFQHHHVSNNNNIMAHHKCKRDYLHDSHSDWYGAVFYALVRTPGRVCDFFYSKVVALSIKTLLVVPSELQILTGDAT